MEVDALWHGRQPVQVMGQEVRLERLGLST